MHSTAAVKKLLFFISLFFGFASYAADGGLFMVVKGDIKVQKLDSQMQPAKVGLKVAVGDTIVSAADSRAKIVMSDRNVINISPMTKLKIEKYTTGADKNVELSLIEGKVRSNVEQEYDGEKTKYLIKTPTAVAGVRGTQFITGYNAVTKVTDIVTLKGQVSFTSLAAKDFGEAGTVLVKKGEGSAMSAGQAPEPPKAIPADMLKSIDRDTAGGDKKGKGNDAGSGTGKGGGGDPLPPPAPPPPSFGPGGPNVFPTRPPNCPPPPPPPPKTGPAKVKVTPGQ